MALRGSSAPLEGQTFTLMPAPGLATARDPTWNWVNWALRVKGAARQAESTRVERSFIGGNLGCHAFAIFGGGRP